MRGAVVDTVDMMNVVDLFAGCGGLSCGFEDAGFNVVAAYENWAVAAACYRENFSHPVFDTDISDTERVSEELRDLRVQMIIGGPPCQDFSQAGPRSEGARANLTFAFADIVTSVRPEWFVMENVGRVRKSRAYEDSRAVLKANGYGLTERILDASYCGVPQTRKRFFVIGKTGERDGFLDHIINSRLSSDPLTVRGFLGDELGVEHFYRHPRNYNRRAVFSIDEPSPTVRGVNRPVAGGYPGHRRDTAPVTAVRALTTPERARIQTFPKDFVWKMAEGNPEQKQDVKLEEVGPGSLFDKAKELPNE